MNFVICTVVTDFYDLTSVRLTFELTVFTFRMIFIIFTFVQNLIKSDIHNHPYKHWEEQRRIQQLDNVLKYNGTLSFRDAQHNEANKQFKGQQDALRNTKKSRMPDGVAEKLQKEFAKYKPHEPEGGPK